MSDFFCALSAVLAILSLTLAIFAVRSARRAAGSSPAKLRSIESRIALLESSVSEWSQLTTDVANSVKMMKVRRATAGPSSSGRGDDLPDPYKDPDGWRSAMNRRIGQQRFNQTGG